MILCVIFAITISVCFASDISQTPSVVCGEIPKQIYACLGYPVFVNTDVSNSCNKGISQCDTMTCVFTKSGWLSDGKIQKHKVVAHYDQFARDHPEWLAAVEYAKTACLTVDLPPQGANLNCPAFDVLICTLSSFFKNAQPNKWSASEQCQDSKRYAASCPVCPSECFAPLVPYGSCNACLALPRSP